MSNTNLVNFILKILLISFEIFENRIYCVVYSVVLICNGIFSVSGSIIGFLNTTEISDTIVAIVSISAQVNGILLYVAVLAYRKSVIELIEELEKNHESGEEIHNRSEVLIKNKLIWFFTTVVLTGILFTVPPLITTTFEESFDEKRSILIPYWYSCGGKEDPKGRICWEVSTASRLTVQGFNMYQATSLTIHIFAYLLSFSLYGLVAGDLEMHMEIINRKVDRINQLAEETESSSIDVEERVYQQFLHVIEYEKFLHECVVKTMHSWKLYLSHYYGSTFFDVTLFIFAMIGLGPEQKLLTYRVLGLVIMRLLMALIVAYYSQNISYLNEEFLQIMSEIRWYNRKAKFRKVYLQVLTFHQKSNLMKIIGVLELNLNCYSRLVRNIYSVSSFIHLRYGK